jgi:hypothetical protein
MFVLFVLPALAEPNEPTEAHLEITSSRSGLEVSQLQGLQREVLCTAPCELQLAPGRSTLALAGRGITPVTQPLDLSAGDRAHLHVKAGSRGASTAGSVFALATVGLLVGSTVSFASDSSDAGFGLLGGPLVTGLIALPLVGGGKTKVSVSYE